MWKLILTIGAVIAAVILDNPEEEDQRGEAKKRVFISFAMKDERYRSYLVSQAKSEKTPFTFIDMSVKKPWVQKIWKKKCRSKIKSCDGLIILLSNNTWHSHGVRWEIKCAKEEGIPIVGMHIYKDNQSAVPPELQDEKVITWSWYNLNKSINKF